MKSTSLLIVIALVIAALLMVGCTSENTNMASKINKNTDLNNLKATLTPMQYKVTQENGTEAPFDNAYWDNHADGIYVDVISGEALFSSLDKYDSGTGWPSFSKPINSTSVVEKTDKSLFETRTEIRSAQGNSHLGHVFDDGPTSTGQRFCINSASLRFIPVADLEKEGYGQFVSLFKK